MKRLFKLSVSLTLILLCIGVLTACFKHEHTYSDDWSADEIYHWHDATCDHGTNISGKQEHAWDEGVLRGAGECDDGTVVVFTCTVCGKSVEKTNIDHNYVKTQTVEPTCTKFGYTAYKCTRCSAECVADLVEATGHVFGERAVIEEATCTESGSQEESCSLCGKVNSYTVNATGHNYVPVSDEGGVAVFECEYCSDTISVASGESVETAVGDEELFDVDISFSFDIVTDKGEDYIRENLRVVETYFIGTEYENNEALRQYTLVSKGNGVYTVSPTSEYEYDTTYSVLLTGDVEFADYKCERLNFTTDEDKNHENSYEYAEGIVFLKALEAASGGYYPYSLSSDENSEYLYLTVGSIDGISVGQIICVGEVTSFDEIDLDTECYFGKVDSFYKLPEGKWMILLSEPELHEIFAELDISYDELINFDSEDVDVERIEDELISALYQDEDFVKFISSVNVAAVKYFNENGYDTSDIQSVKSFMEYVTVKSSVKPSGTTISGDITGNVTVPIKDSHKNEIGKFELTFTLNLTTEFNVNASLKLKKKWGIPYGINYFDVSVTQIDTFTFDFKVAIEVDVSSEEQPFIQNTESGKIHRRGCVHVNSITDLSKLKGLSAIEMKEKIDAKASLECKHCRPSQSFDDHILILNTAPDHKVIHKKGCSYADRISSANKLVSDQNATYWMKQGYQCCEWCHPDNREEIEYGAFLSSTLYCSDWQQIATDVTQWAKDSGMTEHARKGITIAKIDVPIVFPLKITIEVDFIFSFQLEASITYNYKYTQTNTYGMRVSGSGCAPYSSKSSSVISNDLTMMGKVNVKVGLLLDVYINVTGLSKWMSAGITVEVGLYAELYGILHNSLDVFYAAAYLEAGVYLDIQAYYKLFKWNDNFKIIKAELPILTMGYERAYYAYETYYDNLQINGSYDIDLNDLLKVKYFNLLTMKSDTDELSLGESNKYKVIISFADGRYCEVKNGCIVAKANAPASFTDTMIIEVECKVKWNENNWNSFIKDRSVFYLGTYEIELEFGDGVSHTPGEAVIENLVDPTCTESGYFESVVYCIDEGCGKLIKRETKTIDPLGHNYKNDVCDRCGAMKGYSEGLEFTENGEGSCYVSGIGSCTDIDIKIPPRSPKGDKVTAIGDFSIYNNESIVSISIPEGVVSIGSFVFYACSYLESVEIPLSLTQVGSFVLNECPNLKTVYYKGTGSDWSGIMFFGISECLEAATRYYYSESAPSVKGNFWHYVNGIATPWPEYDESTADRVFEFTLSDNGTYYIVTGTNNCTDASLAVPAEHDGLPVKEISDYAFMDCESLVSLSIPESIVAIGEYAFVGCNLLAEISVSSGNANYKTVDGSLYSIDGETLVRYAPGRSDESFALPVDVKTVGNGAFSGASSLQKIDIHSGVTSIGINAFSDCASLTEINVDSANANYKSIDGNLYSKDGSIFIQYAIGKSATSFTLPESVTEIGESAFLSSSNLTAITVHYGLRKVGEDAFFNCLSLKKVYYTGSAEQWNEIEIEFNGNEGLIYSEKTFNCTTI